MKNFILLLPFLFAIHMSYGQIQSGKVTYKINPPTVEKLIDTASVDAPAEAKKYVIKFLNDRLKIVPYLELELLFSPYESVLNTNNIMTNDNQLDLKGALGTTNTAGVYYNNIKKNLHIHQLESMSKLFLIQSNYDDLEWEIHDEIKEIQGYTCIKATTNIVEPARDFPTTVWFAPDLPFPFGPKEFRGLPGLILAMEYNSFYFYAISIDLDTRQRNIKRPSKGEVLSKEEFNKKLLKFEQKITPLKQ
ncbi:MAG TPA: GLPGLI family protein [Flavobacteriaceae bacterium]|nr:GLPGLI family protein [Flavobacteriaceae bacterium]